MNSQSIPRSIEQPWRDHIVLCGLGHVGFRILETLSALGEDVVVITASTKPDWLRRAEHLGRLTIIADARSEDILIEAGVSSARIILAVTNDDLTNIEIALDAKRINPKIEVVMRLLDEQLAESVERDLGVRKVLNPSALAAPAIVAAALGDRVHRTFRVEGCRVQIESLIIEKGSSFADLSLSDFATAVKAIPIALKRPGSDLEFHPPASSVIEAGDEVLVTDEPGMLNLGQPFENRTRSDRPSSHRRRWRRPMDIRPVALVKNIWLNSPVTLRNVFVGLNLLALLSIITFHLALRMNWVDSIYFVATIMSTVGFGDLALQHASPWLKLYGVFLMLSGAALIAILFSMITDFLVTSRVEHLLGHRKTVLSEHIIIAGLGRIGFRVANELADLGEAILGIEKNADSEYVRALEGRIPVLVVEAGLGNLAEQLNAEKARAVVAVSGDDLVNLRIAQRAKKLNPKLRTVVRLFDSTLARKIGKSLGVDRAINPAAIAAETFVATVLIPNALYGFHIGNDLIIMRWLPADDCAACVDQKVMELQRTGGPVVILRKTADGKIMAAKPEDVIQKGEAVVVLEKYQTSKAAGVTLTDEDDFDEM
ncbi:MAG: NAD-binding protein [Armatimonadetes bacterium]|nr:NAD-binding protein [Armatimonadota bacterium]